MSATEWKPGDVAAVRVNVHHSGTAVRVASGVLRGGPDGPCWMLLTIDGKAKGDGGFVRDHPGDSPRPLVVLDPESAEDVQRLHAAYYAAMQTLPESPQWGWGSMQAALRELANPTPPRPDEPTGLGAVVEDDKGHKWVRTEPRQGRFSWCGNPGSAWYEWADIDAVRVLSEGVSG